MATIIAKLEKAQWVATGVEVETLALERYTDAASVSLSDGTYLKVLVAEAQSKLGRKARGRLNKETQLQVVEGVNEKFYPHVLKGVTTIDISLENGITMKERQVRSLERNRRSAFARSSYSTLRAFAEAGGDIRGLDVATVSKGQLRAAFAPPVPTNKVERQIHNAQGALLRACARRARGDPEGARASVEETIDALQQLLEQIEAIEPKVEEEEPTATQVRRATPDRGTQRTRVGVPLLNRGA